MLGCTSEESSHQVTSQSFYVVSSNTSITLERSKVYFLATQQKPLSNALTSNNNIVSLFPPTHLNLLTIYPKKVGNTTLNYTLSNTISQTHHTIPLDVSTPSTNVKDYDVVIVGAGTGGIAAAISAARLGMRVALLEPNGMIGGQMSAAGVSTMDEIKLNYSGFYKEFVDRVKAYYHNSFFIPKSVGTCYWSSDQVCLEPSVGRAILEQMIFETSGIDLYLRADVIDILEKDQHVKGIILSDGQTFKSHILIDATEYGDIIPMTSAEYRIGNQHSHTYQESCIQDITYPAIIKRYDRLPESLKFKTPPPGYAKAKDEFQKLIQNAPSSIPFPMEWSYHLAYRGLPDSSNFQSYTAENSSEWSKITKTALNFANDYPTALSSITTYWKALPTLSTEYLQNPPIRSRINCEAKLKTLQLIYYIQQDLGHFDWSIANDEGYAAIFDPIHDHCDNIPEHFMEIEKHFPPIPYVRESRRIIGLKTLTIHDIWRERNNDLSPSHLRYHSAIALGDHGSDLHGCRENHELESTLNEIKEDIWYGGEAGLFQIPFNTLIPKTLNGFLAAEKNFSVSRLANGATRLQPITMLTGQAIGILAALSIQSNLNPRSINPWLLQYELVFSGVRLDYKLFLDISHSHELWPYLQLASLYKIISLQGNTFNPQSLITQEEWHEWINHTMQHFPELKLQPLTILTQNSKSEALKYLIQEIHHNQLKSLQNITKRQSNIDIFIR